MGWLFLAGGIILLVLYIWQPIVRRVVNNILIWVFQLSTWVLQGAGWLTGILAELFRVIDGQQPIGNIKFGGAKTPKSQISTTPKTPDVEDIDFNDPEQASKYVRENPDKIKVVSNAVGG